MKENEIIKILERQNYLLEKRYEILKEMICDIYDEVVPKKRMCPVCKNEIRCFVPYGKPKMRYHAQCPMCQSLERERLLARFWETNRDNLIGNHNMNIDEKIRVLDIAPSSGMYHKFSNMEEIDFYPVDINPDYPVPIVQTVDITDIPYEMNYFDIIICFHVLENVKEEEKALRELARVLKKGGHLLIRDAIDSTLTETLEDVAWNTPELREKYYGHKDYWRKYGKDYAERIRCGGVFCSVLEHKAESFNTDEEMQYYSLMYKDSLFVCEK